MRDNDEIEKIQEWQEHQHSPLYWVDKFSPLFPPKRTRGFWITSLIGLFLILPGFLAFCWSYFADGNSESLPLMLIFGALSLIMILLTIRLRPDFHKGKRQTQIEEIHHIQNEEKKKKLPKRRKDYG
ncbi:MAG: hypothetical protein ACXW4U_04345 [Anaerolineales bacterium]